MQGPHLFRTVNVRILSSSEADADSPLRVKIHNGQVVMCVEVAIDRACCELNDSLDGGFRDARSRGGRAGSTQI